MQDKKYTLLTSSPRIAKSLRMDASTIRQSYVDKPNKQKHLKFLDIGTWLDENEVSQAELILAVNTIRATGEEIRRRTSI